MGIRGRSERKAPEDARREKITGGLQAVTDGVSKQSARSRELDEENALGIYDPAFAMTLKETFFADLKHAEPMALDEWRRRNPLQKLFETVSRTLDQQS